MFKQNFEDYIAKHGKVCDEDPGWPGMASCQWRSPQVPSNVKKELLRGKREKVAAAQAAGERNKKKSSQQKQVKKPPAKTVTKPSVSKDSARSDSYYRFHLSKR